MPAWLSILLLGNLLGGRRRSFGRSLLFGGLLGWLFHRNFDTEEMQKDMHRAARKVRKAVKAARHEFRDIGRAVREQAQLKTDVPVDAVLEQVEASQARDEERRRKTDERIAAAHAKIEEARALRDERMQRKAERLNDTFERLETVRARRLERQREIQEHFAAVRAEIAERRAERMQRITERLNNTCEKAEADRASRREPLHEVQAEPKASGNEALLNRELVADLERDARTAAMAADVPTISFPEEEKYNAGSKYFSARG